MSTGTKYVQVSYKDERQFVRVPVDATTAMIVDEALSAFGLQDGGYALFGWTRNGRLKQLLSSDVPTESNMWLDTIVMKGAADVSDRNCASCRYMGRGAGRTGSTVLRCFRYPQAIEVKDRHWCGEWAAKERT